jgi:hypothetical protein
MQEERILVDGDEWKFPKVGTFMEIMIIFKFPNILLE